MKDFLDRSGGALVIAFLIMALGIERTRHGSAVGSWMIGIAATSFMLLVLIEIHHRRRQAQLKQWAAEVHERAKRGE